MTPQLSEGFASTIGVSPRVTALAGILTSLRVGVDALSAAVRGHRYEEMLAAIASTDAMAAQLREAIDRLDPADRIDLEGAGIPRLMAALDAAARRNAFLIERAWAADATLMRLLMNAGQSGANPVAVQYGLPARPYVERDA